MKIRSTLCSALFLAGCAAAGAPEPVLAPPEVQSQPKLLQAAFETAQFQADYDACQARFAQFKALGSPKLLLSSEQLGYQNFLDPCAVKASKDTQLGVAAP